MDSRISITVSMIVDNNYMNKRSYSSKHSIKINSRIFQVDIQSR